MKVYRVVEAKVEGRPINLENPYMAILRYYNTSKERRFRHKDLNNYGLDDEDIYRLVDRGYLELIDVGPEKVIGIAIHHRFVLNESYRARVVNNMRRVQRMLSQRRNLNIQRRRYLLMMDVIIPEFCVETKDGDTLLPDKFSAVQASRYVEKIENLRSLYGGHLYDGVLRDMRGLGLNIEITDHLQGRMLQERMGRDPEFREHIQDCRRRNLMKIFANKKRRTTQRRKALKNYIENNFGDIFSVGAKSLARSLEERGQNMIEKHYKGFILEKLVKRDLADLRRQLRVKAN